jgi:hypothetical protein
MEIEKSDIQIEPDSTNVEQVKNMKPDASLLEEIFTLLQNGGENFHILDLDEKYFCRSALVK